MALSVDAVVADAMEADVREVREPVILRPDRDPGDDLSGDRAEDVDRRVVATRSPELRAAGVELKHVRAAAAGDAPLRDDVPGGEVDHGDRALEPVRHIEEARVARDLEPVRAAACGDELDDLHRVRV